MDLKDKIEKVKIDNIIPYQNNPKKHPDEQVKKIANSIQEFGFTVPMIIDGDNTIIAGHGRYKAIQKHLNIEEVPCIRRDDLTEAQIKAFRIADNRITESEWDDELLDVELESLDEEDYNLELTGFEEEEIGDIFDEQKGAEEDDFEEPDQIDSRVEEGQVWKLGKHRLMCGDATGEEDVGKLMDGEEADVLFTDPPYGINVVEESPHLSGEAPIQDSQQGNLEFDVDDKASPKNYKPVEGDDEDFDPRFMLDMAEKSFIFGGHCFASKLPDNPHWIVWDKKPEGNERTFFGDAELIWTDIKDRKSVVLYRHMWSGMVREGERELEGERMHPTQKPVTLIGNILEDYTEEDDIVLDLFGGSGSTLIACEQLDRRCFMMEIDQEYCEVIIQRWEELSGGEAELLG